MLIDPIPAARKVIFQSPWTTLEALDITGAAQPYYRLVEPAGVICVVLSATGDFVMVRQPRPAIEGYTLEFPAGSIEDGETSEDAVRREVLEETGFTLAHAACVGAAQAIPNRMHCPQRLYVGVAAPSALTRGKDHNAETVIVPRGEFLATMQREGAHCVVAIGAIKLAELTWALDLFAAPIQTITQAIAAAEAAPERIC